VVCRVPEEARSDIEHLQQMCAITDSLRNFLNTASRARGSSSGLGGASLNKASGELNLMGKDSAFIAQRVLNQVVGSGLVPEMNWDTYILILR